MTLLPLFLNFVRRFLTHVSYFMSRCRFQIYKHIYMMRARNQVAISIPTNGLTIVISLKYKFAELTCPKLEK